MSEGFYLTVEKLEKFLTDQDSAGCPEEQLKRLRQRLHAFYDALPEEKLISRETLYAWREGMEAHGAALWTVRKYVTAVNHLLVGLGHRELCFKRGRRVDLTGRTFDRLTALEPVTGQKPKGRGVFWRCRCECGREVEVPANLLLSGNYRSCGCLRLENLHRSNGYVDDTCLKLVLSDKVRRDNTSGHTGVFLKRGKWTACIQYKKKVHYLGSFPTLEEAVEARKKAEIAVKADAARLLSSLRERGEEAE